MDPTDEDRAFFHWYGPWASPTPTQVAEILRDLPARWWIVGGWAIEAFSGRHRKHDDIDVGFFGADLPALLSHLTPDYCVWSNAGGTLRPLKRVDDLLDGCRQLWVRRDGSSPWLIDLAMTPSEGDDWISARDDRLRVPFGEAIFIGADGIRYLRPELVLAFKARHMVRHDDSDLEAALPSMSPDARARLVEAIARVDADHPWLGRLGSEPAA